MPATTVSCERSCSRSRPRRTAVRNLSRFVSSVASMPSAQWSSRLAIRPYAADVLGLIEQGRQAAREAADYSMRSLRLVAVATAAEYVVPALLRSFHRLHPEVNLSLEVANRATVFERVLEHEVDVAIAGRPPDDERIVGLAFLKNELALIVAPDDPRAGSRAIRPDQLADSVWLMREPGSGTRQLVTEFL